MLQRVPVVAGLEHKAGRNGRETIEREAIVREILGVDPRDEASSTVIIEVRVVGIEVVASSRRRQLFSRLRVSSENHLTYYSNCSQGETLEVDCFLMP